MSTAGSDLDPFCLGAVLAGGAGSRMGEPKALVELAGRPLISYPLSAVAEAGLEPAVVAKPDSELPELDCRLIEEPSEPRHPLCGVLAALSAAEGRPVVALACDMPFVPPDLLAWLAWLDDPVVVCEAGGRIQPLLARYAGVASELRSAIGGGEASRDAALALDPRVVGEDELRRFGDPARICFNVNDRADLDAAARLIER